MKNTKKYIQTCLKELEKYTQKPILLHDWFLVKNLLKLGLAKKGI